jgi:type I restriction enzyme S subunit
VTFTYRARAEEFFGRLPSWVDVRKFNHLARITNGQVDPRDDRYAALPLFAPNHIESGTGRLLAIESAADQGAESGKYPVDAGDVVYSKIRPALRKVIQAPADGLCSADMYALKPAADVHARFLMWSLLSEGFSRAVELESDRVAMPKVNRDSLGQIALPVPPLDVQRAIADFLDRKTAALDALIDKKERLLALYDVPRPRLTPLGA